MRAHRPIQFLSIAAVLAACSPAAGSTTGQPDAAPVAAAPVAAPIAAPEPSPATGLALNVNWDSRPLDIEYRRERADLDARHAHEITVKIATESAAQRTRRQESENQVLELRYTRGKASHARSLPGQER